MQLIKKTFKPNCFRLEGIIYEQSNRAPIGNQISQVLPEFLYAYIQKFQHIHIFESKLNSVSYLIRYVRWIGNKVPRILVFPYTWLTYISDRFFRKHVGATSFCKTSVGYTHYFSFLA